MRKIVSVAVLTIFILMAVLGLVGCDNGSNEDEHDGPSMHDISKDRWGVAFDNVQNYCVDGFEPVMPSLEDYTLVDASIQSDFYHNREHNVKYSKYSYFTRMRNPLHRLFTNEKIYDQVDVFILTDWIFDYPEKYGLTAEDYSGWEADLVTLEKADDGSSTQDMVIEYKVFYADAEEHRFTAYERKMLKSNFQYPCEITVDGISVMFDVVDIRGASYGRELNFVYLNSGEKVVDEKSYTSYGCVQVEARWEYNNAVYFIRIPLLWQYWGEWLGSSSIEYLFRIIADMDEGEQEALEEYEVAYLKDYDDGYYNIFEYEQERLEWFENKAPDYVKARFTAKKMLEYILPQYFFAK